MAVIGRLIPRAMAKVLPTTNFKLPPSPALRLGARHVAVKLDKNEFERSLPKIVEYLEEPVASSSIVPMYFVCKRAREDVKVALIGQGPDELFGGYNRHLGVHYGNLWRRLPGPSDRV